MLNKKQKQAVKLITKMLKESGEQYTICANQSQIEKDPTKIFLHDMASIIAEKLSESIKGES